MEIEASTHKLYTKKGNPSAPLVHAEQQVDDWLSWLEEHSDSARDHLPGLNNPRGFVVIGRRSSLSGEDAEKLNGENQNYNRSGS